MQVKYCPLGYEMTLSFEEKYTKRDRWRFVYFSSIVIVLGLQTGTQLERLHLNFDKILLFIYAWSYDIATSKYCKNELKNGHYAAVDFPKYMREACTWFVEKANSKIGGKGCALEIEIDQSFLPNKKIAKVECCLNHGYLVEYVLKQNTFLFVQLTTGSQKP